MLYAHTVAHALSLSFSNSIQRIENPLIKFIALYPVCSNCMLALKMVGYLIYSIK